VTARPTRSAEEIRHLLFQQLLRPVRWEESIVNMMTDGASTFVEIGPGKVLQGLVKRINSIVKTIGIEKIADLTDAT
jgi:[acyl-carrier-protein] S-malonyltransferase